MSELDVSLPPPRDWIDETLMFDRPEPIGRLLPTVISTMEIPEDIAASIPEFGAFLGNPDVILAERILGDAPHCFYGDNALNRYAHGSWALVTIGRDNEAWKLVERIPAVADRIRLPKGTLRMTTFLAVRKGHASDAMKSWNALAKWHRGSLTEVDNSLRIACEELLRSMGG